MPMGLLDDYSYESGSLGLGMTPRPALQHQEVMSNLVTNLNYFVYPRYKAISEPGFYVNRQEIVPDIGVFATQGKTDPLQWRLVMFIEIVRTMPEEKRIRQKVEKALQSLHVREALIYNYRKKHWVKCTEIPADQRKAKSSWSDVLQIDLEPYAERIIVRK
ncbi:MAG: hypothetical protein KatS3mg031_0179 [Chitinophagales bacterium]|nr:MAG: hypothetical protein KatS3mg031_0179 [Chitinophagales bacterium]